MRKDEQSQSEEEETDEKQKQKRVRWEVQASRCWRNKPHDHLPSSFTPWVAQGWATRELGLFGETGQVPGKTRSHHKCNVTLLFLYFFGKNKIMCFFIMQNKNIKYSTEFRINNLAIKPSWAQRLPLGKGTFPRYHYVVGDTSFGPMLVTRTLNHFSIYTFNLNLGICVSIQVLPLQS